MGVNHRFVCLNFLLRLWLCGHCPFLWQWYVIMSGCSFLAAKLFVPCIKAGWLSFWNSDDSHLKIVSLSRFGYFIPGRLNTWFERSYLELFLDSQSGSVRKKYFEHWYMYVRRQRCGCLLLWFAACWFVFRASWRCWYGCKRKILGSAFLLQRRSGVFDSLGSVLCFCIMALFHWRWSLPLHITHRGDHRSGGSDYYNIWQAYTVNLIRWNVVRYGGQTPTLSGESRRFLSIYLTLPMLWLIVPVMVLNLFRTSSAVHLIVWFIWLLRWGLWPMGNYRNKRLV